MNLAEPSAGTAALPVIAGICTCGNAAVRHPPASHRRSGPAYPLLPEHIVEPSSDMFEAHPNNFEETIMAAEEVTHIELLRKITEVEALF